MLNLGQPVLLYILVEALPIPEAYSIAPFSTALPPERFASFLPTKVWPQRVGALPASAGIHSNVQLSCHFASQLSSIHLVLTQYTTESIQNAIGKITQPARLVLSTASHGVSEFHRGRSEMALRSFLEDVRLRSRRAGTRMRQTTCNAALQNGTGPTEQLASLWRRCRHHCPLLW